MGEVKRVLITGAGGFIGLACVAAALARGIEVVAVVRGSAPPPAQRLTLLRCDLSDPASVPDLSDALRGCDAAIHAAAHVGDDAEAARRDTLAATRHLLEAMPEAMPLVLVSSITVYDTDRAAPGSVIDESAPLFAEGAAPSGYANAKLAQEALARARGGPLWLMRLGAVWGAGRTWHALNGVDAGPLHLTLASEGELPLTNVTQVAQALVAAARSDPEGIRALNVIDDDRPTRSRCVRAHRAATGWPRLALPVPWRIWLTLTRAVSPLAPRLPGLLREPVLRARIMPLRWPNTALRAALGGQDAAGYEQMLKLSTRGAE
ncbi:NAD-dependent epimerase/dehydratase family protein [Salipiger abyssi]|uniref:NAD-dependent epimerase/dehydratase family protein n=1 Tax=Salipiger abyssi TaxID=1250539 RepID=UPI001A9003F1|nr:NAD-dependent epimerase/dehydratase family protein [Salipiger abyssi]MBN9886031.1 NAD-dependent epimerase/dehydratase family protein [Salipiger abyssi]